MSLLLGQRTLTVITLRLKKSIACRDTRVPLHCLDLVSSRDPAREVQIFGVGSLTSSDIVRFRHLGRLHREVRWPGRLPRSWTS